MAEGAAAGADRHQPRDQEPWTVRAGAVVIATGGCAFLSNALGTNGLTGDGLLLAAETGATFSGMEFTAQYGVSLAFSSVTKGIMYFWGDVHRRGRQRVAAHRRPAVGHRAPSADRSRLTR